MSRNHYIIAITNRKSSLGGVGGKKSKTFKEAKN